ncbi:hypothetical protein VF12_37450 [Nostoc linckia z15]|nr:hypothetical protein VF12_37450 [Nostoc linckia z15]
MKGPNFFLRFSRSQQRGVLALLLLIVLVQAGYYLFSAKTPNAEEASQEEKQWLALQPRIDSLKAAQGIQQKMIYPFNPNFISDYKGYTLGMTTRQIDQLHKFRESGKFVNSASEFKAVTGVSDSLLAAIAPYFKFPDWVLKKQREQQMPSVSKYENSKKPKPGFEAPEVKKIIAKDINTALEEDLVQVYGIGPAFAKKILRRRASLGAFVSMEQMADFPEFSAEAVDGLNKYFKVTGMPAVEKLNINNASLNQLASFPYFNKEIARAIITRRSMKGKLTGIDDLSKINQFPVDKQGIIALYLEF